MNEVEDELHVFFCPAWKFLRTRFPLLFESLEFRGLTDAVASHSPDTDMCFNMFLNPRTFEVCDALIGFLKCMWRIKNMAASQ